LSSFIHVLLRVLWMKLIKSTSFKFLDRHSKQVLCLEKQMLNLGLHIVVIDIASTFSFSFLVNFLSVATKKSWHFFVHTCFYTCFIVWFSKLQNRNIYDSMSSCVTHFDFNFSNWKPKFLNLKNSICKNML